MPLTTNVYTDTFTQTDALHAHFFSHTQFLAHKNIKRKFNAKNIHLPQLLVIDTRFVQDGPF